MGTPVWIYRRVGVEMGITGITGGYFQKLVTPKCKLSRLPEVIVLFKNIYLHDFQFFDQFL